MPYGLWIILPGLWFPVSGCFSDVMLMSIVFFHKTLAKHFETSKVAVIASPPGGSMEQMDPWTTSPLVPIPQASVGVAKRICIFNFTGVKSGKFSVLSL